jgi:hypothetical protein
VQSKGGPDDPVIHGDGVIFLGNRRDPEPTPVSQGRSLGQTSSRPQSIDPLERIPGGTGDLPRPFLDFIQFFYYFQGNNDLIVLEFEKTLGVMNEHIGVQNEGLSQGEPPQGCRMGLRLWEEGWLSLFPGV